ncbi:hypothetical protein NP233_g2387 [Leucocoprinus birnbaumii]|uniref:F-box domain-containing protein n=1 Tax=Leucocoprinus birnbaumii TaxID=56174 RepID=A0AAD5VZ27_9AGAR|nr:hypothetical protein NP233_g2387 [Leucocoprinus birnbaumii]
MHPCLSIPEIIRLVCEQLRAGGPYFAGSVNSSTLASLARTSRMWSEPALDNLWYRVEGVETFFQCMPRDLWEMAGDDLDKEFIIHRPLSVTDIRTFQKYASRVRVFYEREYPPTSAYQALFPLCPNFLLPRLEKLNWEVHDENVFSYIRLLLCPHLKSLSIFISERATKEHLGYLSSIPTVFCPLISQLNLYFEDFPATALSLRDLLDALAAWQNLSRLDLSGAPVDTLWCISKIPDLKSFRISFPGRAAGSTPLASKHFAQSISKIENITISEDVSIQTVANFFRKCQLTSVRHLHLTIKSSLQSLETLELLLSSLSQQCSAHTLEVFHFEDDGKHTYTFSQLVVPLLQFSKLKRVTLLIPYLSGLSDQCIAQVASSWPLLESFVIFSSDQVSHRPTVTLQSLLSLASGCPNLWELGLAIDATDLTVRRDIRAHPERATESRNYSLRVLNVSNDSLISHKEFVASFLSDLFPNLVDIPESLALVSPAHHARWKYVAQVLLPILSRTRERQLKSLGFSLPQGSPPTPGIGKAALPMFLDTSFGKTSRTLAEEAEGKDRDWSDESDGEKLTERLRAAFGE